ncbi:single-stranded DNA-binding protein [Wenyingzhuangia marina]|uniref:Single-stranded DNA-binding protein n=1 Tax=Wenyingzhuangia marina TaxID=1195760 RepID=A0A1M5SWP2_9FLAO|nr:single-stranded DNA-binding protein [Wenyingzhuangia marina]GGF64470.1 single-stranded DNA-binding protein [Wenyingzhuangia marina]SHH42902.1 single-strand binding protein [Wenyingzhuangia marina]
MAGTLNKVMLIGHLGDNVKTHYFDGGGCIARFPLATNETYTNKTTGEKTTTTEWHNIVVRNKLAEICEKFLTKGDKVYCEGKIKTREWELEGVKKYTTEIHVVDMNFLSSKNENKHDNSTQEKNNPGNIIDDLPF